MPLVQIRDVPEVARRILKARAAAQGQSLNSYLLGLIEREVAQPTLDEVLDRAARRVEQAAMSSVEAVRQAREERDLELMNRAQP